MVPPPVVEPCACQLSTAVELSSTWAWTNGGLRPLVVQFTGSRNCSGFVAGREPCDAQEVELRLASRVLCLCDPLELWWCCRKPSISKHTDTPLPNGGPFALSALLAACGAARRWEYGLAIWQGPCSGLSAPVPGDVKQLQSDSM